MGDCARYGKTVGDIVKRALQVFDSGQVIVLDGQEAQTFVFRMRSTSTTTRIRNISPGALYCFIFHQDAQGGHSFVWPSKCINAVPIDGAADATSVQCFIGATGGYLYANAPQQR